MKEADQTSPNPLPFIYNEFSVLYKGEIMRITFDSVEELKTFCRTFRLEESTAEPEKSRAVEPQKAPHQTREPVKTPPKYGEKSLIQQIREEIASFSKAGKSFSMNTIVEKLLVRDKHLNTRSILTSASRLLNTEYAKMPFTEEAGKGPRRMKVYHPR